MKDAAAGNFLQAALTMRMIMKGEEEYQISCTVKFGNEKIQHMYKYIYILVVVYQDTLYITYIFKFKYSICKL